MAGLTYPKRGEIWTADLRPGTGYEIAKIRPALIISSNTINQVSPMVVVIPISSQNTQAVGVTRILLKKDRTHLDKNSIAVVNQIRSIDKSRCKKKIGKIPPDTLNEIEDSLKLVLGMINLD